MVFLMQVAPNTNLSLGSQNVCAMLLYSGGWSRAEPEPTPTPKRDIFDRVYDSSEVEFSKPTPTPLK
jgi:hypothetical protein